MIVRVRFDNNHVMLFGDSYKPWWMQFEEYVWRFHNELPRTVQNVETSQSEWVSWGGLKWCSDVEFQHELNREGRQSAEPDNLDARQYKDMRFRFSKSAHQRVTSALLALPITA